MNPTHESAPACLDAVEAAIVTTEELARIEGGHNGIDGCIPNRPIIKGPYVPPVVLGPNLLTSPR